MSSLLYLYFHLIHPYASCITCLSTNITWNSSESSVLRLAQLCTCRKKPPGPLDDPSPRLHRDFQLLTKTVSNLRVAVSGPTCEAVVCPFLTHWEAPAQILHSQIPKGGPLSTDDTKRITLATSDCTSSSMPEKRITASTDGSLQDTWGGAWLASQT